MMRLHICSKQHPCTAAAGKVEHGLPARPNIKTTNARHATIVYEPTVHVMRPLLYAQSALQDIYKTCTG
eukprot:m.1599 g.1599  ORF g.1599 m.1599 type:complete len:69 (-) comp1003_c0_seq1:185-391(-)